MNAEHLCEQIEQLAEADISDLKAAQKELNQLKQRFQDIGAFPREQQDAIKNKFKAVCDQFKQGVKVAQVAERQQGFKELWRRAQLCDQAEQVLLAANTDQLQQLQAQWNSDSAIPEDALALLQARFDDASNATQAPDEATLQENAGKLHDLCIKLEIAAGVDSPAQDQQRRMELQVSRLSSGLNQRAEAASGGEQVEALQIEWCAVGPVAASEREQFSERFKSVLVQLKS